MRFSDMLVFVHLPFRFEEMDKHRKKQKLDLEAREAQAVANRGRAGGAGRDGTGANGQPSINMHVLDELRKLGQKQREDEAKRIEEALRVSGRRLRNPPGAFAGAEIVCNSFADDILTSLLVCVLVLVHSGHKRPLPCRWTRTRRRRGTGAWQTWPLGWA